MQRCLWLIICVLLCVPAPAPAQTKAQRTLLVGAWTPDEVGLLNASGLGRATRSAYELQLLDAIGRHAGIGFSLRALERLAIDEAVARGDIDFALPVIRTPARSDVATMSRAYATRNEVLFLGSRVSRPSGEGPAVLRAALAQGLRIGTARGDTYGAEIDAILGEPAFAPLVSAAADDDDNLDRLIDGEIDGFLAPRLSGLIAIASRAGASSLVTPLEPPLAAHKLHIMFSKATVDAATVAAVDEALLALQEDGTEAQLRARATAPILLNLAAAANWFHALDIIGTVAFALSGVLIARREEYSALGAFVLAALPAVGGGIVRDLLVGRSPIGVLQSPEPLSLVVGTVVLAYLAYRIGALAIWPIGTIRHREEAEGRQRQVVSFRNAYELTDALGLATFTVIGVIVAVRFGAEPLWLWGPLCAALSGAGGGILRDVLRADSNNPALRTSFYAEICLIWGLVLAMTVQWLGHEERPELLRIAVACTVLGAFLSRIAVVALRVRSPRF